MCDQIAYCRCPEKNLSATSTSHSLNDLGTAVQVTTIEQARARVNCSISRMLHIRWHVKEEMKQFVKIIPWLPGFWRSK